jgi:uncharacterized membrane protein
MHVHCKCVLTTGECVREYLYTRKLMYMHTHTHHLRAHTRTLQTLARCKHHTHTHLPPRSLPPSLALSLSLTGIWIFSTFSIWKAATLLLFSKSENLTLYTYIICVCVRVCVYHACIKYTDGYVNSKNGYAPHLAHIQNFSDSLSLTCLQKLRSPKQHVQCTRT